MHTPDAHDVRMRGFASRSTVAAAQNWVDETCSALESESVTIQDACGRVTAADCAALVDVPSFPRAAMDGYAVQAASTIGAGDLNPLEFKVIGEALPGRPCEEIVTADTCVRIMTGSPLPSGADAVIPVEFTSISGTQVRVVTSLANGKHVGQIGEDVRANAVVVQRGRRLRPQDAALLAAVGFARVDVIRRPRVRLLVTGNEIVPPGHSRSTYQIFDANTTLLRGLIRRDGGEVESVRRVVDDATAIESALTEPGADIILVSGGSSVGAEDHAPHVLRTVGNVAHHGIAMRPSSPAGMGTIDNVLVFLLPGNPVSCLCAYDFFAGRAVRLGGGRGSDWPYPKCTAVAERKFVSAIGRVDYCRVTRTPTGVAPLALSGASILSSTTRADGFVVIPESSESIAAGADVDVLLYDS